MHSNLNKNWKENLQAFLQHYRATPHSSTGVSPNEAMGFPDQNGLPFNFKRTKASREFFEKNDTAAKKRMKSNADSHLNVKQHTFKKNQNVLFKWKPTNKHQTRLDPNPYKITDVKGTMITAKNKFHEVTRNSSCFQSYLGEVDLVTAPTQTDPLFIINSNIK